MIKIIKMDLYRYRSHYQRYFIVVFLSILISSLLFIAITFFQHYQDIQRKDIYGYYHGAFYGISNENLHSLFDNQMIDQISVAKSYGSVFYNNDYIGEMGEYSDYQLMSIQLYKGHFPTKENEIVLEMSMLDYLKLSYDLNQTIQLTMDNKTSHYQIVGIAYNYSSLHQTNQYSMINILSVNQTSHVTNVYFSLKEQYTSFINDFRSLNPNFIINQYAMNEYHTYQYMYVYIFLFSLLSILSVTYYVIQKRKYQFYIFNELGCYNSQIVWLYCIETTIIFTLAVLLDITIVCLIKVLFPYLSLSIVTFIKLYGAFIITYVLSCIMSIFIIHKGKQRKHRYFYRKKKNLSLIRIQYIMNRTYLLHFIFKFILVSISGAICLIGLMSVYHQYDTYHFMKETYPYQYSYGDMSMPYENTSPISEEEYKQLQNVYGIKNIHTVSQSPYYSISYQNDESEYANYVKEHVLPQYTGNRKLQGAVYGISESLFDIYKEFVQEGQISLTEFKQGDIILHLPLYYEYENGFGVFSEIQSRPHFIKEYKEKDLKVGDEIVINGQSLRIGAIIYDVNQSQYSLIYRPYGIICNQTLYKQITKRNTYEFISIESKKNINIEQMEAELSRIKMDNVILSNNRQEIDDILHQLLSSFLGTLFIVLIIMISFRILFIYMNQEYQNSMSHLFGIFRDLYADDSYFLKFYLINDLVLFIGAFILSLGIIFIWFYQLYLQLYNSMSTITLSFMVNNYILNIPFILWIIMILFNFWLYRSRKKNVIHS